MITYGEEPVIAEVLTDGTVRVTIGPLSFNVRESAELRKLAEMMNTMADWVDEQ